MVEKEFIKKLNEKIVNCKTIEEADEIRLEIISDYEEYQAKEVERMD